MKNLIKRLANEKGVIILTDSDRAGFIIRNHIKNIAPNVIHAYIPEIKGKERRKKEPGKEGLLGVEGIEKDIIIKALLDSGATIDGEQKKNKRNYTKLDLYNLGYIGKTDSRVKRREFLPTAGRLVLQRHRYYLATACHVDHRRSAHLSRCQKGHGAYPAPSHGLRCHSGQSAQLGCDR